MLSVNLVFRLFIIIITFQNSRISCTSSCFCTKYCRTVFCMRVAAYSSGHNQDFGYSGRGLEVSIFKFYYFCDYSIWVGTYLNGKQSWCLLKKILLKRMNKLIKLLSLLHFIFLLIFKIKSIRIVYLSFIFTRMDHKCV